MGNNLRLLLCSGILLFYSVFFLSCDKRNTSISNPQSLDFSSVEKLVNDSVAKSFGGKCVVVIHVDGKLAFRKVWGGFNDSTKQLVASCSKWLAGAVLMSLVDEGKIKLTDSVGQFLPVFNKYKKGRSTIGQLFSHTSGFPGDSKQGYEKNDKLTLAQAVDSIARRVSLINAPGTKFYYGGISMQIAGRICEVVSGKSWNKLFSEKILIPCGMSNTSYGNTSNPAIAGGARTTADDYVRFLDMLIRKGVTETGTRVLSQASVIAMEQSQIGSATIAYCPYTPEQLNTSGGFYGIGNWRDLTDQSGKLIEGACPGAYGTHPWLNFDKRISGVVFLMIPNASVGTPTCLKLRSLVRSIVP
jgi:CubicO group peptidase (beta-lactamase class C family)